MSSAYVQERGTGTFKWDGVISYPGFHSSRDFNGKDECYTKDLKITNYRNKFEVRNCRLDLNQGHENVRIKIAEYMNRLISIGVAEVIDMGEHTDKGESAEAIKAIEYTGIARLTNFIFGVKLAEVFRGHNPAGHLNNWGEDWKMPKSEEVVVFIDNHDNQRGHGAGGLLFYNNNH
ncbi:AMY [Mytilus coruscus]|uniref:AMY n=1 Tax=Mytilus coruscus TaxID=42192 RepID=A0A6J8B2N0_MYTCO|nr:AMY [Mytilus coruscus]